MRNAKKSASSWGRTGASAQINRNTKFTSNSPIHYLLDRLDAVRETGAGRWVARCPVPAHDDRHPSLSVRETADGTVLLKCWAGCGAADVVAAVGLELRDLFPPRIDDRPPLRKHERWASVDVLRCLAHEVVIVLVAAEATGRGEALTDADRDRLAVAAGRLRAAVEEVANG